MGATLNKGEIFQIDLQKLLVGISWELDKNLISEIDLDMFTFMLADNKIVPGDEFLIFYNCQRSQDGAIESDFEGLDNENMLIDFNKINKTISEIVVCIAIHQADERNQNFSMINNLFIRINDQASMSELCRYNLSGDCSFVTGIEVGRFLKTNGSWQFEAIGYGYKNGVNSLFNKYLPKSL